jgi:two-component system sensor histidine kinase/response regulator
MNILIVDDMPANRRLLVRVIESFGYEADVAVNGAAAVDAAAHQHFDLIFMDLHMPGLDGLGATRRIRELGQDAVRIYALTGMVNEETRRDCLAAGMDGYLAKPLMLADIAQIIRTAECGAATCHGETESQC